MVDRCDARRLCLLEDLHVQEGGMVRTLSVLEVNDPQEDLAVRRSELGKVPGSKNWKRNHNRTAGSLYTPPCFLSLMSLLLIRHNPEGITRPKHVLIMSYCFQA